ncbi:hypothetical protein B0A55_08016 [Friedmanniomyces simplex]|uniref:Apple domain-containing protein n=1 Tax=Friedmanniomyces simplex TaxID=329884 RepID=A0A4U0X399_9PEZI|nr:hypothetical protein B0A55_08016 [Friedmanniomyces simplex]
MMADIPTKLTGARREPQRLSALYQYHNAPEVAPAHGLEYDDTVYPSSDKYPVIREAPSYDLSNYKGKHSFPSDNRPPRIIFGMKVRTFLVVALVVILITVGAAVGGAVGGKSMRENQPLPLTGLNATSPTPTTPTPTVAAFSAPTPTYTPLSACQNHTTYASTYALGTLGPVPATARLKYTLYCNLTSPLSQPGANKIAQAYTYTLRDCIEVCAGYNFWNAGSNCTVAAYEPAGVRPGNCWVGYADAVSVASLAVQEGVDVALLDLS